MSSTQSTPGNASAIDMSQFFQVFFDEAAEHLADMETQLLAVDPAEPDAESLNAIFRAAHSIKGGSGTFGFTDMAELTHEAETLLDRLRKRELQITVPMIDTLLEAGDVLRAQLARHRGESREQVDAAPIVRRLNALASETNEPQAAARSLSLQFTLIAQANFDMLLADLSRLGEITTLQGPDAGRNCKVGLLTDADDAEISVRLRTAAEPASIQVSVSGQESAPVADPGYGFFSDDPAPVRAEPADPGYGFFTDAPAAPGASAPHAAATESAASWGRRSTDDPNVVTAPAGRRGSDKQVVSPNGDSSSIRVGVDKVDQLINLVGELVITQAMLSQKAARLAAGENVDLSTGMADLERNTRDLQESVMSIRMLPMSFVFNRFPRMLRDLAAKLGKQVELKTIGEQTELDKGVIEKIADPMNHLVRNSVDHGIELPEERLAAGKPAHGTLTLRAYHQGGNIVIEVADDGKGLDRSKILAKATERGLKVSEAMSDQEVWLLIFEPGFSTADKVTDVSGRGVGMDVVKKNILALGGSVELESATGHGTRVIVRLPLTLAIMDGMSIAVRGDTYIIPLASVVELLQPGSREIKTVSGQGRVVEVRSEYLPVVSLSEVFGGESREADDKESIMVIVEVDGAKTALLVDELVGQHQVVVKSLEANYRRIPGISGATIMGDGRVALIMDIAALVKLARH
ncbi:MAG: chemotaxis protein CheW [Betaproteobacteria bacterium]|nr:chemotaxis protein CheW [Betaproteobacteria bacterium]